MDLDWRTLDRWIMGEAWIGSRIIDHRDMLCDIIGPRWASSDKEWRAVHYIRDQMQAAGLDHAALEEFQLDTWAWDRADVVIVEDDRRLEILPFLYCPPVALQAPIVDAGYGTPREIDRVRSKLPGAVAVMAMAFEPFTTPIPHAYRLRSLADAGAVAAVVIDRKDGRRMEYHSGGDFRDPDLDPVPLPTVATCREDGILLRARAVQGHTLRLNVDSRLYPAPTANVVGTLTGTRWPDEHLVLGGHHDTVYGASGGNDNASGTIAVLETARVLARLQAETGCSPGRSIRFVTYSAEEQGFQGAFAYVRRHYGPETSPRLSINLDELSAGHIKGIVLGFPHLRDLVQAQLDTMKDGLQCHVMAQIDASSDHFPFLREGIDAAHLWRWRFHGRHADSDFHHEPGDTSDKLNVRELKEYIGQLARILLRLSHVPPEDWPHNPVTPEQVGQRLGAERGTVIRVI